ncbi:phospholipase A and acyltransferase 4-like [Limanda limanda]|uniref:phospholipase A and acyltransferase 4-like n=1 Tax=Limanda limanda TaxID=27771 RepID=UPI0029C67893|nr:phospholipase A and acyltransferase 4-like [Limanda limanda]
MIVKLRDVQICSIQCTTQDVTEADRRRAEDMAQKFKGKPGDLIEISRGTYQHWAVYIGKNEVVHFGGLLSGWFKSLSSTRKVKREKLANVVGSDRHQVNNLKDDMYDARDPSIIVKEALEMVGSKLPYNVDTYNCEHFATEMRYGKAESLQVKKPSLISGVRGALVIGGPVAAGGVTGAAVADGAVSVLEWQFRSRTRSKEEIYPF